MEAAVLIFWIMVGIVGVSAILMILGFLLAKRKAKNVDAALDDVLSEKTVENVLDLNDNFNRARYMDKDGN